MNDKADFRKPCILGSEKVKILEIMSISVSFKNLKLKCFLISITIQVHVKFRICGLCLTS